MDIAQFYKFKVHKLISCSNLYIFVIRETCLKYGRYTHFGRAKVKGHTMMQTYTQKPMSLPSVNLLHLTKSNK